MRNTSRRAGIRRVLAAGATLVVASMAALLPATPAQAADLSTNFGWAYDSSTHFTFWAHVPGGLLRGEGTDTNGTRTFRAAVTDEVVDGKCAVAELSFGGSATPSAFSCDNWGPIPFERGPSTEPINVLLARWDPNIGFDDLVRGTVPGTLDEGRACFPFTPPEPSSPPQPNRVCGDPSLRTAGTTAWFYHGLPERIFFRVVRPGAILDNAYTDPQDDGTRSVGGQIVMTAGGVCSFGYVTGTNGVQATARDGRHGICPSAPDLDKSGLTGDLEVKACHQVFGRSGVLPFQEWCTRLTVQVAR